MFGAEGVSRARNVAVAPLEANARDQLERAHAITRDGACVTQKLSHRVQITQCTQRRGGFFRPWEKLQHRAGDNTQRTFGTDEQMAQRVAGVVFAQRSHAIPHAPIGQHDLKAQNQIACVAVT